MKKIEFYRTYSYSDNKDKRVETRDFETIDLAKEDALNDENNYFFTVNKITMIFDGIIKTKVTPIGRILCKKDLSQSKIR